MSKPFAWSYSLLQAFETCPRRFKLTRLTKTVVEPQSEAMTHGNEVHKSLELAVADGRPLPAKHAQYQPFVNAVLAAPGVKHAEMKFGLTRDFRPTEFFGRDVWLRGILDLRVVLPKSATVIDWKTGKPKADDDQMRLFAVSMFSIHPEIDKVRTGYAWLAHNKLDSAVFHRADAPAIWQEFIVRVGRVTKAADTGEYPPRPSGLCRNWCPVPRGMCEFSGKQ